MFITENAFNAQWSTIQYYGWSWIGLKIDTTGFTTKTIETHTLLFFGKFGWSWMKIYHLRGGD